MKLMVKYFTRKFEIKLTLNLKDQFHYIQWPWINTPICSLNFILPAIFAVADLVYWHCLCVSGTCNVGSQHFLNCKLKTAEGFPKAPYPICPSKCTTNNNLPIKFFIGLLKYMCDIIKVYCFHVALKLKKSHCPHPAFQLTVKGTWKS